MEFHHGIGDRADDLVALFRDTFTESEGAEEGQLVGGLARDLLSKTPGEDLFVFSSREGDTLTGCIAFSRLTFAQDERTVFLLSPVAIATRFQKQGIGQRLLRHGLDAIRGQGVDVAVTYGDPDYYSKVGFAPVTEDVVAAPVPLGYPKGWQAQSLTDRPLDPLRGPSRCVAAFDDPRYW